MAKSSKPRDPTASLPSLNSDWLIVTRILLVLTFRQIMQLVVDHTGRFRPIISVPWTLGELQGEVMQRLPINLFTITRDQVRWRPKFQRASCADINRSNNSSLTMSRLLQSLMTCYRTISNEGVMCYVLRVLCPGWMLCIPHGRLPDFLGP